MKAKAESFCYFKKYSYSKDINSEISFLIFIAGDNCPLFLLFPQNPFGLIHDMTICFNHVLNYQIIMYEDFYFSVTEQHGY